MEKTNNSNSVKSGGIIELDNRKNLKITGVNEVLNFNEEKINLNTTLGKLSIKGQNLKVNKLDVKNGDLIIEGFISSLVYSNKRNKGPRRKILHLLSRKKV